LHWYGQQKLTAKSIKPTQKNPKYNNILPITHAHERNTNEQKTHAYTHNLTIPIQN